MERYLQALKLLKRDLINWLILWSVLFVAGVSSILYMVISNDYGSIASFINLFVWGLLGVCASRIMIKLHYIYDINNVIKELETKE